jgi:hypothetical protein
MEKKRKQGYEYLYVTLNESVRLKKHSYVIEYECVNIKDKEIVRGKEMIYTYIENTMQVGAQRGWVVVGFQMEKNIFDRLYKQENAKIELILWE